MNINNVSTNYAINSNSYCHKSTGDSEKFKDIITTQINKENNSCIKDKKYNPTNCTYDEFTATVKALANEGKLSSHDILLTTANFEKSLKNLNPNFKYYITQSDSRGARNWIDEFQALAEQELSRGNRLGYKRHIERKKVAMRVLELLN